MGLFGTTKKKRIVSTSVAPVADKNNIISSVTMATNDFYLFRNKSLSTNLNSETLSNVLQKAVAGNLVNKFKKAKRMADNGDYYYGKVVSNKLIKNEAAIESYFENYITTNYSSTFSILYNIFDEVYNYHFVWQKLKDTYNYSFLTNQLGELTSDYGQPCFLIDAQVYYCDNTVSNVLNNASLEPIGLSFNHGVTNTRTRLYTRSHNPWINDNSLEKDYFKFQFELKLTKTRLITKELPSESLISDITTYNGTVPSSYLSVDSTLISDTTTSSTTEETQTIIHEEIYVVEIIDDFLAYEWSGNFDESIVLDEADADLTDPDATSTADGSVVINTAKDYFMCMFAYTTSTDTYYDVFTYEYGKGTNLVLDNIFDSGFDITNFYPRIYLRTFGNKLNNEDLKDTVAYKDSVKFCKHLGLNYDEIVQNVHENIGSLDKVKQILIGLYCPLNNPTKEQASYLVEYFKHLYDISDNAFAPIPSVGSPYPINYPEQPFLFDYQDYNIKRGDTYVYKDNINVQSFNYKYIGYKIVTGSIGSIGHADGTFHAYDWVGGLDTPLALGDSGLPISPFFSYRKQLTDTTYIEVVVHDPSCVERIESNFNTIASRKSENLLIPIDSEIAKQVSMVKREILFLQCLYFILHVSYIVKIKWYQRDGFTYFLQFIAVLFAIPSGGESLTWAELILAVIAAIVVTTVIKITLTIAIDILDLNPEEAFILEIVVAYLTGQITFDTAAITALDIINSINIALNLYQRHLQEEYVKVLQNMAEFSVNASEQLNLLEEQKEKVGLLRYAYSPMYSPSNFRMTFFIDLGETPDKFFTRRIGNTNPGTLLFDYTSQFVEVTLTLPKPTY